MNFTHKRIIPNSAGIRVLSLFDGISCGKVALDRNNIQVKKYVSYEINQDAIAVSKKNHSGIEYMGDINTADFEQYYGYDLLIGGSPCQDLSIALRNRKGLSGNRSSLFYKYVDALNTIHPKYFLFENNYRMPADAKEEITKQLGVEPIMINSSLVSAQNRKRYYWTNIPIDKLPEDKGILIKDIIYDDSYMVISEAISNGIETKNYIKWDRSGKGYFSQQYRAYYKNGKMCTLHKSPPYDKTNIYMGDNTIRRLHPVEWERLQTLPDGYTEGVPENIRKGLCGDGWTVDVIAHIFSYIK